MPEQMHATPDEHRAAARKQAEIRAAMALAPCSWCDAPDGSAPDDCPMPWRHADRIAELIATSRPDVVAALAARATCGHSTELFPRTPQVVCVRTAGHRMPNRSADGALWRPVEPWPLGEDPDGGELRG